MKLKKSHLFIFILSLMLVTSACQEAENTNQVTGQGQQTATSDGNTTVKIEPITPVTTTKSVKDNYVPALFSNHIWFHKTDPKMIYDFDFFPQGTDFCQQATFNVDTNPNGCKKDKTILLPCDLEGTLPNDAFVQASVNAPQEGTSCSEQVVLDVSDAEFSLDGIILPVDSGQLLLSKAFGFRIENDRVIDVLDNSILVISCEADSDNADCVDNKTSLTLDQLLSENY